MHARFALPFLCTLASTTVTVRAQGLVYTWPVNGSTRAVHVGDVDQDGHDEILVSTVGTGTPSIGRVAVRSVRLGSELYAVQGTNPQDGFGFAVIGLGDVDQDGIGDFAVSAIFTSLGQPGYVRAFSGATGTPLWQRAAPSFDHQYGSSLDRIGDIDQDGADEIVVGSPTFSASAIGRVEVLSGATGAILRDLAATPSITRGFGVRVARALDLDQDGVEDVLACDDFTAASQRVRIFSGASGAVLRSFADPAASSSFGQSMTALADVNGDGVPDYVLGSRTEVYPNGYGGGRARVFSGANGALLLQLEGAPTQAWFGEQLDRFPDLDGDGFDDILLAGGVYRLGCCTQAVAEMRVVSSVTGASLVIGPGQSSRWATTMPDANGDGIADYLVPSVYILDGIRGTLAITGFAPPAPVLGCLAKISSQGCRPRMAVVGSASLSIGDDLALVAAAVVPNTLGIFVWSTAGASVPFAGGTLCLATPIRRFPRVISSAGLLDGCGSTQTGRMTRSVTKPELAAMGLPPGSTFFVQGWFRDPGFAPPNDVGLTDSVSVVLWP